MFKEMKPRNAELLLGCVPNAGLPGQDGPPLEVVAYASGPVVPFQRRRNIYDRPGALPVHPSTFSMVASGKHRCFGLSSSGVKPYLT